AGESRFGDANFTMYAEMYKKPAYLDLLDKWEKIAEEVGCTKAELAYRWVAYHSALEAEKGDGVIVGASSLKQLEATFEGLEKGPLPGDAAKRIEGLWEGVSHEAPVDNFHR
ncbi:MAG: Aflatoxin B1 aldehyde reductase member 2, partial [Watsoniomyces obsoletus]